MTLGCCLGLTHKAIQFIKLLKYEDAIYYILACFQDKALCFLMALFLFAGFFLPIKNTGNTEWKHNLLPLHKKQKHMNISKQKKKHQKSKSLLLSHHHSTSALVNEILKSVLQTVKKKRRNLHMDSTYLQTVQKTMCKIHIHILSTHSVL